MSGQSTPKAPRPRKVTAARQRRLDAMADDVRQEFARQIKAERARLGLSQRAFAALLGKDPGYISLVERGVTYNLRIDTMVEIADRLGMDLKVMLVPRTPQPKRSSST